MALTLNTSPMLNTSNVAIPLNQTNLRSIAPAPYVAAGSTMTTQDAINAITEGLKNQGIVNVNGDAGNIYKKPANVIVTQSGSTATAQTAIINSTTIWGAGSGTWTYSDGNSGKLTDYMISQYGGHLYLAGISVEAQNSSGTQDASAIAALNLQLTNYAVAGEILGNVLISTELSPSFYQSGTLAYSFKNANNPYGLQITAGSKLTFTPTSGDKFTFILRWEVA